MIPRSMLPAVLALWGVGCASRTAFTGKPHGKAIPESAVARVMRRQVLNAADAGDGDYRARVLRHRIAAEPGDLAARLELAAHYQNLGFPELAVEHYRLAAARFPSDASVHLRLAKSLRSVGLASEGAQVLARFAERNQSPPADLLSWLGILRDELGEWSLAEQAHRRALAEGGRKAYLHNNLGYNLLLHGRNDEAAEEFRKALALEPVSDVARNNLGMALAAHPEQAVREWQAVSDAATAHNNLAAVLIEQGRYGEARKEIDTALGYKPDHPAALGNLKLISELDGGTASFVYRPPQTLWMRFTGTLRKAFVEPEHKPQPETVDSASTR